MSERRPVQRQRRKTAAPPETTGALGHVIDAVFFRVLAVWLLVDLSDRAGTLEMIAVFFGLFFMPDALRGKNSLIVDIFSRILTRDRGSE